MYPRPGTVDSVLHATPIDSDVLVMLRFRFRGYIVISAYIHIQS